MTTRRTIELGPFQFYGQLKQPIPPPRRSGVITRLRRALRCGVKGFVSGWKWGAL